MAKVPLQSLVGVLFQMGNVQTEEGMDFLLDNYTLVGEEGKLKLLEDKATGSHFALKEQCFVSRQDYDRNFKKVTQRNNNHDCQNILQLVKIWSKEHNGICSNLFKIYTVYEYPKVKLIDEIEARHRERKYFEEIELFSILQSCLNATTHQHEYVNLSPHTIFILPEGILKLIHVDLQDPNYRTMYHQHYYYSPEKIQFFQKEHETPVEIEKESVFSLGMTLLHSALLKSPASCYEVSFKKFNHKKLETFIREAQAMYGQSLGSLLEGMLCREPYDRYYMDQVQTAVTDYFSSTSQTMKSRSSSLRIEESIKMATHQAQQEKAQEMSLIYSGDTFIRNQQSQLGLQSHPKKQSTDLDFNLQEQEDLPKNHSILQKSKKPRNNTQNNNKENIYTDPKIIELIRSGMEKISKSSQEQSYFTLAPREQNQGEAGRVPETSKDPFAEYELATEHRDKCMFIVQTYEDQTHFEGMVQHGMKNGFGRLVYPDGVYYEGNFQNDTLQGKGSLFYGPNRPAYVGDWVDNKFHGKGTLYNEFPTPLPATFDYRDFNKLCDCWVKYEGEFEGDIKEGVGKIVLTNGETMEGSFSGGLLNGQCVFRSVEGLQVGGVWRNNLMILN